MISCLPNELLEHVLECLPVVDLGVGRSVCKRWDETIKRILFKRIWGIIDALLRGPRTFSVLFPNHTFVVFVLREDYCADMFDNTITTDNPLNLSLKIRGINMLLNILYDFLFVKGGILT